MKVRGARNTINQEVNCLFETFLSQCAEHHNVSHLRNTFDAGSCTCLSYTRAIAGAQAVFETKDCVVASGHEGKKEVFCYGPTSQFPLFLRRVF